MKQLEAQQLHRRLQQGEPPLLLDVREDWEFAIASIEDSRHIPMNNIPDRLDELDPGQETVVICHHGMRSEQVAHYLEQNGFSDVSNLSGGIDSWAREVDNSVPVY